MATYSSFLYVAFSSSLMMFFLWFYQVVKKRADIVDAGWAFGLGVSGLWYGVVLNGDPLRRFFIAVLSVTWGLRLASHLFNDRVLAPEEDGRYLELRKSWGQGATFKFLLFFQLQAALIIFLSIPFWIGAQNSTPLNWIGLFGVFVWIVSVGFESLSDFQLKRFKSDSQNKGKVCNVGLWKYSRHPNYFFEWLHWTSYVFLAFGGVLWWLSLLSPLLILYLILYVTGIPPTEARAIQSRGEAYRSYQETTNAFFPWFPKSL